MPIACLAKVANRAESGHKQAWMQCGTKVAQQGTVSHGGRQRAEEEAGLGTRRAWRIKPGHFQPLPHSATASGFFPAPLNSRQSLRHSLCICRAAFASQSPGRCTHASRIRFRALGVPRWMFAVSSPME